MCITWCAPQRSTSRCAREQFVREGLHVYLKVSKCVQGTVCRVFVCVKSALKT